MGSSDSKAENEVTNNRNQGSLTNNTYVIANYGKQ